MKQEFLKAYTKYRLFIFPVVATLASLIIIAFVIYPQINKFLQNQQELENVDQRLRVLEVKAENLDQINEAALTKNLSLSLTALPADKDYTGAIGMIQNLISQSGLNLVSFQLGQGPANTKGPGGFVIKLQVSGPRSNFNQLLTAIEKAPRIMKISTIDVSSAKDSVIDGNIVVDVFYAPTPGQLGAIDSDLPKITPEDEKLLLTLSQSAQEESDTVTLVPRGKANPFE